MIGDFQPFTLFKVVKQHDLIQEEIYCIKEPCKKTDWYSNEYYKKNYFDTHFTYYALFKYYANGMNSKFNLCVNPCFEHADSTQIIFDTNIPIVIYRSVTKEEYYAKLKEKYDRKCLNIILKRLVDETFQSDFL